MRKIKDCTVYKHFKGKYYYVLGVAKNATNTGEKKEVVVYKQLYDNCELYIKDLEEFASEVDHEKYPNVKQKYRFKECKFNTTLKLFGFEEIYNYGDSITYANDSNLILDVSKNTMQFYKLDNDDIGVIYLPISDNIILLSEIIRYNKFGIKPIYHINEVKEGDM